MKWLYLHFPQLYMEHHYRDLPMQQPFALKAEHGHRIISCNQAAKASGIDAGMLLNTAFCLCPRLQVETWQPHKAMRSLATLGRLASEVSGWVSLDHPDGLYLEIASMRRFFGSYRAIGKRLTELFGHAGYTFNMAAAPNPGAARLLSRNGCRAWFDQKRFLAFLKNMPVEALDIHEGVLFRLQKIGVRNIAELIELPLHDVAYRVGEELAIEIRRLTGQAHWEPAAFRPPEAFSWRLDLEQEFDSLLQLRFALTHGLKNFCHFMQQRCCISSSLNLFLLQADGHEAQLKLALAVPDNRLESWVYRLNISIEKTTLSAPVRGMRLTADDFVPLPQHSLPLFSTAGYSEQDKSLLINRLAIRLGTGQIHFLGLGEDARPERQTLYSSQPMRDNPETDDCSLRPVWLLAEPNPVNVEQYTLIKGPVRIASGWEDQGAINRDYYVARTGNHALHWIFRTPQKKWMWHGIFA